MSQPDNTFQPIQYEPNAPKKRSKYRTPLNIPTIPLPLVNADNYRSSPSSSFSPFLPATSLLLGSPSSPGVLYPPESPSISPLQPYPSLPPTPTFASFPPAPFTTSPLSAPSSYHLGSPAHLFSPSPSQQQDFLPAMSSAASSPIHRLDELRHTASYTSHPASPITYIPKRQRFESILADIAKYFDGLGGFLEMLCEDFPAGPEDIRTSCHRQMLSAFLSGNCNFRVVHFIEAIYRNRFSVPKASATQERKSELQLSFNGDANPYEIHYARPAVSIWALKLVAKRCASEVGKLGKADPAHPELVPHIQASANPRMSSKRRTVSQDDVLGLNMQRNVDIFKIRAPATWAVTESMAAQRKNGVPVVHKRRPHPFIQAVAISMLAVARNRSANSYFALPIGIWLFASKTHWNVKRVLCLIGLSVHDTTVRKALITAGAKRKAEQQVETAAALTQNEPACRKVLDNVQQYQPVHEHGLGKTSKLITGTAATALRLEDCNPGSFALDPYQESVIRNERASLTVDSLHDDIKFEHLSRVFSLHLVRILCEHCPALKSYLPVISARFRSAPIAIHRMRDGRKTHVVPLSCNSHAEMEVHGMKEAQKDFDKQVGYTAENVSAARILVWDGGDGGSVLSGNRVMRHLLPQATSLGIYDSFESRIWTPGLFHVQLHLVNAIAENHYGPKTTKDPSALSRAAAATDLYTPPKLSSCDFYPTTRAMRTIFEARVLDLWDFHLAGHTGRLFEELASASSIPTFDKLLADASSLVRRYMSTKTYHTALDVRRYAKCPDAFKFPLGPVWTPDTDVALAPAADTDEVLRLFSEDDGFTGDRVLANSVLFLRDFMLFEEMSEAMSEGDIGRVYEVLKLLIFVFAGASKQNYTTILLDLYCLFRYEASRDLKNAIWNNWLVNLAGIIGKWLADDLMQEHYNKCLEDMVSKHGGTFDDPFLHDMVSLNVNFFLRLKEELDDTFHLKKHGKSHTSPGVKDETRVLMNMFRDDKLHYFCEGRSMGHAAKEFIGAGYDCLDKGKLKEFKANSTEHAKLLALLRDRRQNGSAAPAPGETNPSQGNDDNHNHRQAGDSESDAGESDSDAGESEGARSAASDTCDVDAVDVDDDNHRTGVGADSSFVFHMDPEDDKTEEEDEEDDQEMLSDVDELDCDVDTSGWETENI